MLTTVWRNFLIALMSLGIIAAGVFFVFSRSNNFDSQAATLSAVVESAKSETPVYVPPQKLSNPPAIIKAVYVTAYSAGSKKYLDYLSSLFKTTEINAVVVDVKGSDGIITYPERVKNIDALINFFHKQNIYVIGRIANFEDPVYSTAKPELAVHDKSKTTDPSKPVLWKDNNGLSWLDPASKDVWNYNISLAKDALYHGFDEINFDYVRFPTDGKKEDMDFPVWDGKTPLVTVIKSFFQYVRSSLPNEKISVDLFGQTTTSKDDMGIGQLIENAFENFDYIAPMVYPSHYVKNFMNFTNAAEHPYEVVKYSLLSGLIREKIFMLQMQSLLIEKKSSSAVFLSKFRPWLQDFNMGADYNADMVKLEIKATQDALGTDYSGFMLWNPANIYTQGAITKPD